MPAAVGLGQQPVEVGQRAEERVDGAVVGDVVAEVVHGRWVDRRKPDRADVQALQVVEAADDARQVAHAVAVAVLV